MPSKYRAPLFKKEYAEWEAKIKASPAKDLADTVVLPAWAKDGYRSTDTGGEKDGYRDAMDDMRHRLIENGATREYADRKSREVAKRVHRRSDNDGKLK